MSANGEKFNLPINSNSTTSCVNFTLWKVDHYSHFGFSLSHSACLFLSGNHLRSWGLRYCPSFGERTCSLHFIFCLQCPPLWCGFSYPFLGIRRSIGYITGHAQASSATIFRSAHSMLMVEPFRHLSALPSQSHFGGLETLSYFSWTIVVCLPF